MKWAKSFIHQANLFAFLAILSCLSSAALWGQQAPAPDQKPQADSKAGAPSAAQSAAPASSAQTPPATPAIPPATPSGAEAPAVGKSPQGLDPKTGIPLYETIQEDWSSLEIGTSKLEPEPPLVGQVEDHEKFTRVLVQVKWRPGDPIDLWIILPKGVKRPPAVLYLYGFSENTERFRDEEWAQRVTSGGVAAVGFSSALSGHRFHDRPMKQWFVSELQESIGSSVHDVKFILDYLAERGEVDMNRIGMWGEGSGATIAILAAAADPRIKAVDALEPWGAWPDFLAKSSMLVEAPNHEDYLKPEFLKKVAPLDPVKWLPQIKTPIRVQQIAENDVVPMASKESIKDAAPKQAEMARFMGIADLSKRESEGRIFQWIKDRLQELGKPGAASGAKVSVAEKVAEKPQGDHNQAAHQ